MIQLFEPNDSTILATQSEPIAGPDLNVKVRFAPDFDELDGLCLVTEDPQTGNMQQFGEVCHPAYGERIERAWNACHGLTDEELELIGDGGVKRLLEENKAALWAIRHIKVAPLTDREREMVMQMDLTGIEEFLKSDRIAEEQPK